MSKVTLNMPVEQANGVSATSVQGAVDSAALESFKNTLMPVAFSTGKEALGAMR